MVLLSGILPTRVECGVLNGQVKPGNMVAIVGAGPVGLAVLLTAQFYSPASIFMMDVDDKRLAVAKKFGATTLITSARPLSRPADVSRTWASTANRWNCT